MTELLQQHLNRVQQRMKLQADKNRSFREFSVGDLVFLKLQPDVQKSVSNRACHKLSFKYYGPFPVLARIGTVAYKLLLPAENSIHPIFHVSQLKLAHGFKHSAEAELPHSLTLVSFPLQILDSRHVKKGNRIIPQVLVVWSDSNADSATWEDKDDLKRHFPFVLAWGQASSKEEGLVKSVSDQVQEQPTQECNPDSSANEEERGYGPGPARRSSRTKTTNSRYYGPTWAV